MSWTKFEEGSPELATKGALRLNGQIAYLATIKRDGSPRLHPVRPFIGKGHLFIFIDQTSHKGNDLLRDERYALYNSVETENELLYELFIAGSAKRVTKLEIREQAEMIVGSSVPDQYRLFTFHLERVLVTEYNEKREPIRYRWDNYATE